MVSRSRMPPPSWTGMSESTAAMIALTAASFRGLPATAPFRSTTCRRRAPCSAHCAAAFAGIVGEHRGRVHVALLEANAVAVLQVDGGNDQHGGARIRHGFQVAKLLSSVRPATLLFSGWNCVAKMLSRAMAEVKAPA